MRLLRCYDDFGSGVVEGVESDERHTVQVSSDTRAGTAERVACPLDFQWRMQASACIRLSHLLGRYYSVAPSAALVWATVQSAAPTLKRAKRRTVMFSPSLPTFCAINSLMLTAWSLMKGCSSRQTSS